MGSRGDNTSVEFSPSLIFEVQTGGGGQRPVSHTHMLAAFQRVGFVGTRPGSRCSARRPENGPRERNVESEAHGSKRNKCCCLGMLCFWVRRLAARILCVFSSFWPESVANGPEEKKRGFGQRGECKQLNMGGLSFVFFGRNYLKL